jgi:hypothetical protein
MVDIGTVLGLDIADVGKIDGATIANGYKYLGLNILVIPPLEGDIGIFGASAINMDYIYITSIGNATNFGDMISAISYLASCASSTRGVFAGGNPSTNRIEYITIVTRGNGTDFGDLTNGARLASAGCSSSTRGVFAGGIFAGDAKRNYIDYITIATATNSVDFGDMIYADDNRGGLSSTTRGVFAGGSSPYPNHIDYITIASTGNCADFGDLTLGRTTAGGSNSTRGIFAPGTGDGVTIDYITIATTGNATNFGTMTSSSRRYHACSTNSTRLVFAGGYSPPNHNIMDYITIASTGNTTDFGDLTGITSAAAGLSNCHGGL